MACRPYNTGRCLLLRLFNPSKLWGSLHTFDDNYYPMSFYFSFKSDHLSELQEIVI